nr:hypothetical protein EVB34_040 [Rhizobium phage RHph_TM26]
MIDVAEAIDEEAVQVAWRTFAADTYSHGNLVPGAATPSTLWAMIQPASGRTMSDVPEGLRVEVALVGWSRTSVAVDNEIDYGGETYRVGWVKPWPMGNYTKFAMMKKVAA